MSPEHIKIDNQDGIYTITLNRPDKRNAFINAMIYETADAFDEADRDSGVRVIVITGEGKGFSSGADVAAFQRAYEEFKQTGKHTSALDHGKLEEFALSIRQVKKPIIAAINGPAVGLGFTLAVACDIRIAAENARLGAIFMTMALTPEFGSSYSLTRLVGIAKACELVFTAKIVDAQEALAIGLVNQVVPTDQLMTVTMEMAKTIASFSAPAMAMSKQNLYNGMDANVVTQARGETLANMICRQMPDHGEGIAAFLEKRTPAFNK